MTVTAFGLGMQVVLGDFDAGWVGERVAPQPVTWRPAPRPQPRRWSSPAATETEWEVR